MLFCKCWGFGFSYILCVHTCNSGVWWEFCLLLISSLDLIWDPIENSKKQEMAVPTKVIKTVDKKLSANSLRFVFPLPFISIMFWFVSSWRLLFVDINDCSSVRSTVDLVDVRIVLPNKKRIIKFQLPYKMKYVTGFESTDVEFIKLC